MNPLLYVLTTVSLGVIAIMLYAVFFAPDGYEDEEGFHAIRPRAPLESHSLSRDGKEPDLPPFLSAH